MIPLVVKNLRVSSQLHHSRLFIANSVLIIAMIQSPVKADAPNFVPYTVTLLEYQLTSGATASPPAKYIYAIRSDGSRAFAGTLADGSMERILTFSSGRRIYVFDGQRQKSTTFDTSRNPLNAIPDPLNGCASSGVSEQLVGTEQVDQYRTVKIVQGPMTRWLALDYGCAPVKEKAVWGDGQASEKRLVSLTPGEPTDALFSVPDGFKEVPPSVLFPGLPSLYAAKQDSYYNSHRP